MSDTEAALGTVVEGDQRVFFVPEKIGGYTISQIGYQSGEYRGKGLYYSNDVSSELMRFYYPATITSVYGEYMKGTHNVEIMYCGSVVCLEKIYEYTFGYCYYYVPYEYYDEFANELRNLDKSSLKCANVVYDLNYEGREYYYVDYVGSEGLVENIPPEPVRDNYTFDGWYTEKDFQHKWDFITDNVIIQEGQNEVHLYAKWIEKRLSED